MLVTKHCLRSSVGKVDFCFLGYLLWLLQEGFCSSRLLGRQEFHMASFLTARKSKREDDHLVQTYSRRGYIFDLLFHLKTQKEK
jgi:hypothetical protein